MFSISNAICSYDIQKYSLKHRVLQFTSEGGEVWSSVILVYGNIEAFCDLLHQQKWTKTATWMSNHIHSFMWDIIIHPRLTSIAFQPNSHWGEASYVGDVIFNVTDNYMMTSSNGNIFRATGHWCGEVTGHGEFPTQRPVTRSFDVFFELRPNKQLSKQPWGWWFETLP